MKAAGVRSARKPRPRKYRQDVRARQTQANVQSILKAAAGRLRTSSRLATITLDEIAADAGVTVRTILRQYGSKDALMEAAFIEVGRQVEAARPKTEPADIDGAIAAMLAQYESQGDLNTRVLAEEFEIPILHKLLEHGRAFHRQWLIDIFGPRLAHLPHDQFDERITALYAATEVQLWKILRRDLHQSAEQTTRIFQRLVRGLLAQ